MVAPRLNYSGSCALFGDIKTAIMDSNDTHFAETQNAYEWVSLAKSLLPPLIKALNSEVTKKALITVLDDGNTKLSTVSETLAKRMPCINSLASRTTKLKSLIELQFRKETITLLFQLKQTRDMAEKRPKFLCPINVESLMAKIQTLTKFYDNLSQKIDENISNVDQTKAKLQDEIEHIVAQLRF